MLAALIGAGATLGGGLLNMFSQNKQMEKQEEFAQRGLTWKARDAERAGISKLYAMGAPSVSYSPISTGGGLGTSVADAGQQIGRAMEATSGPATRASGLATDIARTQLDGLRIDNEIKRADLLAKVALRTQAGQPPGIMDSETTMVGQGNSGIKLKKEIAPAGSEPQKSFGVSPEVDMWRTKHGYAPEVPQALGEAQESQPASAAQWFLRNKILPSFSDAYRTYPYPAPQGSYWQFNPVFGEYTLRKGPRPSWNRLMEGLSR